MDEEVEVEVEDGAGDRASRIDLTSGFMKHIIHNQKKRDDYDKEVRLLKEQSKKVSKEKKNHSKRPEQAHYAPPTKGNEVERSLSSKTNGAPKDVFKLQYEDPDGEISEWLVHKGDHPQNLADRFGRQCKLTPSLIDALASLIEEEMNNKGIHHS